MCTGRVDLSFILRAFQNGADGVIIGGCWPGECHYVTEGNYDALVNVHICKMLLEHVGVNPERLRIEWIAASEGSRFAEIMNEFPARVKELGPLGAGEGMSEEELERKLAAATHIVPYIKLVEREKLRVGKRTEEALNTFYRSEETKRLFNDLVIEKLDISQILLLLQKGPRTTAEISEVMRLSQSDISKYMNTSSRRGLVRYDVERRCYALP